MFCCNASVFALQSRLVLTSTLIGLFRVLLTAPTSTWQTTVSGVLQRHALRTAEVLQALRAKAESTPATTAPVPWSAESDSKELPPAAAAVAVTPSATDSKGTSTLSSFMSAFKEAGKALNPLAYTSFGTSAATPKSAGVIPATQLLDAVSASAAALQVLGGMLGSH
jgi:hypothetical protein